MNDFTLVLENRKNELFFRYIPLIKIFYKKYHWHFESFEDLLSFAYIVFDKAYKSLKLDKIKKKDTWTFYIVFYRYLDTYIKEDLNNKNNLLFKSATRIDNFMYDDDNDRTFNIYLTTETEERDVFTKKQLNNMREYLQHFRGPNKKKLQMIDDYEETYVSNKL